MVYGLSLVSASVDHVLQKRVFCFVNLAVSLSVLFCHLGTSREV